jgi:hypothetical protein
MTVIAWDGKSLAGDKMTFTTPVRSIKKVKKIISDKGIIYLVGCSGSCSVMEDFFNWCQKDFDPELIPKSYSQLPSDESFSAIVISRNKNKIIKRLYDKGTNSSIIDEKYLTIGAGGETAKALLLSGCDSKKAILYTNKVNALCGMGVDVVTF